MIQQKQHGFTLVELAIVMIIIGLLIGGVLKGQELVENARIAATISQIKGIDGAISTFKDKYGALPGDMLRPPSERLRNCAVAPCSTPGNGDSRITTTGVTEPNNFPTDTNIEGVKAFMHLAAADLISGIEINGELRYGSALPESKMGGGFWIGHSARGDLGPPDMNGRIGHYLVMQRNLQGLGVAQSRMYPPDRAAQIDRKLDDGNAALGDIQATGSGCRDGQSYLENSADGTCGLFIRIQG